MDNLLPCPFCGTAPELKRTGPMELTLRCPNCTIKYVQKWLRYSEEWLRGKMVENWNRRATLRAGGVWVPVEPTEAMVNAARAFSVPGYCIGKHQWPAVYAAMLAAVDSGAGGEEGK